MAISSSTRRPGAYNKTEDDFVRNPVGTGAVITRMIEKITLRVFLICLVSCGGIVLTLIWLGGPNTPDSAFSPIYFKAAATFFIIGLGSFLCWFVTLLSSLRERLS